MVRKPGLHAGILVRYIVEKCRTVEEALQALRRLPISSSQTLTIADAQGKMVVVECNCEHMEVIEPEIGSHFVAATNLFRHPHMIKYRCDLEDTIFSEVRYQTAVKALQKEEGYSLSYGMDILAGKVGFMCQYDRSQGLDTVWSSVYDITNRKVYRAEGNPAHINYIEDKRCTFQ